MIKDSTCKSPHIPVAELDALVETELLNLAENPSLVDEIIKKRAAGDGGSKDTADKSEAVKKLDEELSRLMDLLQYDQLVTVEEIAERISEVHAERMKLSSSLREIVPGQYDVEAAKMLLRDIRYGWSKFDLKGRRAFLFQLIDGIHIDTEGMRVVWSFE